jgi:hypothetical protein
MLHLQKNDGKSRSLSDSYNLRRASGVNTKIVSMVTARVGNQPDQASFGFQLIAVTKNARNSRGGKQDELNPLWQDDGHDGLTLCDQMDAAEWSQII